MSATPTPQLVEADGDLHALTGEWDGLAERTGAGVFQRPAWLLAWWRRRGGGALRTIALREAGRLVALAPLFLYARPQGGRQLTFIGNGDSDHLDALYQDEAAAGALADAVVTAGGWEALDLRDLPAASPFAARLAQAAGAAVEPEQPCPYLDLATEPPRKMRRNLRYYARRAAAEVGELAYRQADAASLAGDLETLVRLHAQRWPDSPVAVDPRVRAFHKDAAAGLLGAGILRLFVLEARGAPIAALYGFHAGAVASFYLSGVEGSARALSPGTLLFGHAVERARLDGAAVFDFLRGDEGYKYLWGAKDRAKLRLRR